jgi:predicted DNA-binding protein
MADSKAISIRLPDELLAKVNKLAEEKYKSIAGKPNKSLVVQNALIAYFDTLSDSVSGERIVTENDTVSIADFKELQDFVSTLSKDVEELKKTSSLPASVIPKGDRSSSGESLEAFQLNAFSVSDTVTEFKITIELLAKRLGSKNPKSIQNKKSSSSDTEFSEWTGKKDLNGIPWKPIKNGRLVYFIPAIDLSDELKDKLRDWLSSELLPSLSERETEAQSSHA